MLLSRTLSIAIPRDWRKVYDAIWRPECFARWASGLSQADLTEAGGAWTALGPEGPIRITFTPQNPFGVMDHVVESRGLPDVYVPMRVIANQEGAEIQLTLFCQPGMSADKFAADAEWVHRDLDALRAWIMGETA